MVNPHPPLIDLPRHLDGAIRLETVIDLGRQHNIPLPAWDVEGLRPHVQVPEPQPGVMAFLEKFKWLTAILVDYNACRRIAYENVQDLLREGIDYAELRFSPWFMAERHGLDAAGGVEAVVDGVEAGVRDFSVPVQLIGILSRTYGDAVAARELDSILSFSDHLVGLDLAGDEANLTSNVQTSTVPTFDAHPLRRMLEAGLLATINTDDPGISGITLKHEYEVAAPAAGLTDRPISQAQANALQTAFLHPLDKQTLLAAKQD